LWVDRCWQEPGEAVLVDAMALANESEKPINQIDDGTYLVLKGNVHRSNSSVGWLTRRTLRRLRAGVTAKRSEKFGLFVCWAPFTREFTPRPSRGATQKQTEI
jgi:hypothetical protein